MSFVEGAKQYYEKLKETIDRLDFEEIDKSMEAIREAYQREATIYVCGNGGSAATASHMANDFNKGISERSEKKFKFYCLNDNVATLMAIANDISYDEVFSFQLTGRIKKEDLLIAISGSGNSRNIIRACEVAKSVDCKIVGLSGFKGGKLFEMSDYQMHVGIEDMQIVEDVHMSFDHMMMKLFAIIN